MPWIQDDILGMAEFRKTFLGSKPFEGFPESEN
jgi:hypothetical protein